MRDNSNISQELLETIERYHNQDLSQLERQNFEQRLQNDREFKSSVEDIESFLFGIEQQALNEKLEEFHNDLPIRLETDKKTSKIRQYHFMKIAAAAVIVIAVGSFWFLNGSSNERLYDTYFKPDPGLQTTMGSTDNYSFYDGMVNYKQGDYKQAIAKWEVLEKMSPQNDTLNYFIGVAYLADKDAEKAVPYLGKTTSIPNSVFISDAYYYLGLAYLKTEEVEKAKTAFKQSQSENSQKILKELQ